jgi:hypothetical protein
MACVPQQKRAGLRKAGKDAEARTKYGRRLARNIRFGRGQCGNRIALSSLRPFGSVLVIGAGGPRRVMETAR